MVRQRQKDIYTNALTRWILGLIPRSQPTTPSVKPAKKETSNPTVKKSTNQIQLTLQPIEIETVEPIQLREYQQEAVNELLKRKKGTITHATGLGKTFVALEAIRRIGPPVAIFVPTIAIMEQVWLRRLKQMGWKNVGVFYGHKHQLRPITIFLYQSAIRHPEAVATLNPKLVIFDEIHHVAADEWSKLLPFAEKSEYALGLSILGSEPIIVEKDGLVEVLTIEEFAKRFIKNENEGVVSLKGLGYKTLSLNNKLSPQWSEITAVHRYRCNKNVYTVTLENGFRVRLTDDHSIYVLTDNGDIVAKKTSDLTTSDYALCPINFPKVEKTISNNLLSYLLKLPLSDIKHMYLANLDDNLLEELSKYVPNCKRRYNIKKNKYFPIRFLRNCPSEIIAKIKNPVILYSKSRKEGIPVETSNSDLFYLIGIAVGDGWITKHQTQFSIENDSSKIKRILTSIKKAFGLNATVEQARGNNVEITINNIIVTKVFKALGLKNGARNKVTPPIVYSAPLNLQRRYIEGLIDSDGHISKRKNRVCLHYVTTSRKLAVSLAYLFLQNGDIVGMHKRRKSEPHKLGTRLIKSNGGYDINLTLTRSNLAGLKKAPQIKTMIPVVSFIQSLAKRIPSRKGEKKVQFPLRIYVFKKIGNRVRKEKMKSFLLRLQAEGAITEDERLKLSKIINSNLVFLRIKQIKLNKRKPKFVYDLSTETESFCGGDLIFCHNTATLNPWDPKNYKIVRIMPVIHTMPIGEARREGWVPPIKVYSAPAPLSLQERVKYEEYNEIIRKTAIQLGTTDPTVWSKLAKNGDSIARKGLWAMAKRRALLSNVKSKLSILLHIIKSNPDSQIILFSESIKSVEVAKQFLTQNGIKCETYHSEKPKNLRQQILRAWEQRQFRTLMSVTSLEEGVDVPDASVAIFLASGKSPRKLVQRVGRILRKVPGKIARVYVIWGENTVERDVLTGVIKAVSKVK